MARSGLGTNDFRADVLPTPGFTRVFDVVYTGALKTDIWKPNSSNRPIIALLHGGGWSGGDKTDFSQTYPAARFADLGFCVFSFNVTLTGGAPQTPIDNVKTFMTWVRANAATYNGDGTKVAILGSSAGAQEALMAAIQGVNGGTRPDAIVAWSPPANLGALTSAGATFAATYMGTTYAGDSANWDLKSPTLQMVAGMCPVRIVGSASEDVTQGGIAQTIYDALETACNSAGVSNVKRIFTGSAHAEMDGRVYGTADDINGTAAWLRTKLGWSKVAGNRAASAGRTASAARTAA